MHYSFSKNTITLFLSTVFGVLSVIWIYITFFHSDASVLSSVYSWSYGLVALIGGIFGVRAARRWGGTRSLLGRSILSFSIGLLLQEFGQISFTYYTRVQNVDIPYPSIAEIGFLGYLPFYLLGMYYLAQVAGVRVSIRSLNSKLIALCVLLLSLLSTYIFFLKDYAADWSALYVTLVDYAYTIGQSFNISFMVIAYLLSRKYLGGVMKFRLLFVIIAYFVQYASDFTFLYQAYHGSYQASGITDYMYLVAYYLMAIALVQLGQAADKLTKK